ncbi:hypothetical protein QEO93_04650 [Kingella negevensis]|uniref:hypothetical protein n=2 Tax=Kingella negevensis TaxID=1522312 RepID=UPI0015C510A7|nr:hypothetical protein [Kingella negevensis]WII91875.1 hypothetical protein QEO93_04650 [Kingella negevensis]
MSITERAAMYYLPSLLFDYPEIYYVLLAVGVIAIRYSFTTARYPQYIACYFWYVGLAVIALTATLSLARFQNEILKTPTATYFYVYQFDGKNHDVRHCFEKFSQQNQVDYADFMDKCLQHEEYQNLVK